MFATQKETEQAFIKHYMTWTYPLQFCMLCHIYILLHVMLQSGDISRFLFQGGFSSWSLLRYEPTDYHCSGVHFAARYVFFSGSGLLLFNSILDYGHFPKDTGRWGKPTFQRWQEAPPLIKASRNVASTGRPTREGLGLVASNDSNKIATALCCTASWHVARCVHPHQSLQQFDSLTACLEHIVAGKIGFEHQWTRGISCQHNAHGWLRIRNSHERQSRDLRCLGKQQKMWEFGGCAECKSYRTRR